MSQPERISSLLSDSLRLIKERLGVPISTGSWFLLCRAPPVPGSWDTKHHWLLVPRVPISTGFLFLLRQAPPVSGFWGSEHHRFLVPGLPSSTGSWFLGYRTTLVPGTWGTKNHWSLVRIPVCLFCISSGSKLLRSGTSFNLH